MRNFILFTAILCFAGPVLGQTNYYSVKFPDDQTYIGCNAAVPVEQPIVTQYSCNINVGISRFDQVFNTNESGTCFKILRRWRLNYWCDYNANIPPTYINNPTNTDVGPTVFGNAANHGYLEYIQVIKVFDNDPPTFIDCPAERVLFCDYTNNNTAQYSNLPHYDYCEGPVDLQVDITDACSGLDLSLAYRLWLDMDSNGSMETFISSSSANAWPVETTTPNGVFHGKIVFPSGFQLPYGVHKIEWIAGDNCGNESTCKYEFEVRDCKKPTVVCLNGLSVNIMQTGMITLWASDFLQYASDNCTPSDLLKIAIRKSGTGTGFPTGSTGVTFDCSELGSQLVEIWALDQHGNADFCETYIVVQDNMGICAPTASIANTTLKTDGSPKAGVILTAKTNNQAVAATATTNANGQTLPMALMPGCYTVAPAFPVAGAATDISAFDALLLEWNNNAINPFETPWKFAAADVNHDGYLNTNDVSAIVQMAIGGITQWPGVANWQFIPSNAEMPDSLIAFEGTKQICLASNSVAQSSWIAVKSGDLDGSGDGNQFTNNELEDRSPNMRQAKFTIYDKVFIAGETIEVAVLTPELAGFSGFQMALAWDPNVLDLLDKTPGLAPQQQLFQRPDENYVRMGWVSAGGYWGYNFENTPVVTLTFTAIKDGKLSNCIDINKSAVTPEVYLTNNRKMQARLRFVPVSGQRNDGPELFAPTPNPVLTTATLTARYLLPKATNARIAFTDVYGHELASQTVLGEAGYHEVQLPLNGIQAGVYAMQLITDEGVVATLVEVF